MSASGGDSHFSLAVEGLCEDRSAVSEGTHCGGEKKRLNISFTILIIHSNHDLHFTEI